MLHYGLKSITHAKELIAQVVFVLGGGEPAFNLLLETSCAETQCGTYPDRHPYKLGVGPNQHDEIHLVDIQQEGEQRHFDIIKREFGYDIEAIKLSDLANDPLLSFICCRLSYKRIPEAIPNDLIGRARYWKEYYNTAIGDGTVEHYLASVADCLGDEWK